MIKLNDHYFIAWLKVVKGYSVDLESSNIAVDMTPAEYTAGLEEYNSTAKPVLKEVRTMVKTLAGLKKPQMAQG